MSSVSSIVANEHNRRLGSLPPPGVSRVRMFASMELEECLEWIALHFLLGRRVQKQAESELFALCQQQPQSLHHIRALVEKNPSIVQARNDDGHLALHIACRFGAPLAVVQYLVQQYPASVQILKKGDGSEQQDDASNNNNNNKLRPLHWACWGRASMDVIHYLVAMEPAAVRAPSRRHLLPLHYACLQFFPLPPCMETVQFLLSLYPEAISTTCGDGNLPLHYACSNGEMSRTLIEFLVQQYPHATQVANHQGNYPLHCALDPAGTLSHHPAPLRVIELFLENYPNAMTLQNNAGYLPLHLACGTALGSPSVEIIRRLVRSCPRAVLIRDGHGMLPLDRACFPGKPTVDVLECLQVVVLTSDEREQDVITKLPEKEEDEDDYRDALPPLHFACRHGSRVEVVRRLMELYPNACAQPAGRDGLLPLHCTSSSFAQDSTLVTACNNHNNNKDVSWSAAAVLDDCMDEENMMQVLELLLKCHPAAIYSKSAKGDTALHFACRSQRPGRFKLIQFLVQQDPSATMTANVQGLYPLHEACLYAAPAEVLFYLGTIYPDPFFLPAGNNCNNNVSCNNNNNNILNHHVDNNSAASSHCSA
jgi:ankyrin repeat protein